MPPSSAMPDVPLPAELRGVPGVVLQEYVKRSMLGLAGSSNLARTLNLKRDALVRAVAEVLGLQGQESACLARSISSEAEIHLVFRHDCLNLGCLDSKCSLCAENPNRRCEGNFGGKYLAGDVLKAKCGASIRVEAVNPAVGGPASPEELGDAYLEMCILDGRQYASVQDMGRHLAAADVLECVLLQNNQGRPLLAPGRAGTSRDSGEVTAALTRGHAYLPDLCVTGSSEALLSGQKPPFRLLVRALRSDTHEPLPHIRFLVSEAFVIATPRVRSAAKAEIPHLEDHVSKLQSVGVQTQNKLQDIAAAAQAVGIYDMAAKVPANCVTKVGQFRELVLVAEQDPPLCDTLKKVLKLTKGWEVARDHALSAVGTDNQMRIWYAGRDCDAGVLFKCAYGTVDLDNPAGLLEKGGGEGGGRPSLQAKLVGHLSGPQRDTLRRLTRQAASCWWRDGHEGWAIWQDVDSEHFMRTVNTQSGSSVLRFAPDHPSLPAASPAMPANGLGQPQGPQGGPYGASAHGHPFGAQAGAGRPDVPLLVPGAVQHVQFPGAGHGPHGMPGPGGAPAFLAAGDLAPQGMSPGDPLPHWDPGATSPSAFMQALPMGQALRAPSPVGLDLLGGASRSQPTALEEALAGYRSQPLGAGQGMPAGPGLGPRNPFLPQVQTAGQRVQADATGRYIPPLSPFATDTQQNSAGSSQPSSHLRPKDEMGPTSSELDGHRRKRHRELKERLSQVAGKDVDDRLVDAVSHRLGASGAPPDQSLDNHMLSEILATLDAHPPAFELPSVLPELSTLDFEPSGHPRAGSVPGVAPSFPAHIPFPAVSQSEPGPSGQSHGNGLLGIPPGSEPMGAPWGLAEAEAGRGRHGERERERGGGQRLGEEDMTSGGLHSLQSMEEALKDPDLQMYKPL